MPLLQYPLMSVECAMLTDEERLQRIRKSLDGGTVPEGFDVYDRTGKAIEGCWGQKEKEAASMGFFATMTDLFKKYIK